MSHAPLFHFEILINEPFSSLNEDASLSPVGNKHVLSAINDFEDGKWRYAKFQNFIWDNIAETALSVSERESLAGQSHSLLTAAAKSLRLTDASDDVGKGSELAEIILYGIMKNYYNALPVVPKIFYKQNCQDNAKGADSVHIVVSNNDFSIWFGEAKFYDCIEDARLGSIVDSVEKALQTDKLKKENSIITNVRDLDTLITDQGLKDRIKESLKSRNSIDSLKPRLHIPILFLHKCSITEAASSASATYKQQVKNFHINRVRAYFKKQINKLRTSVVQYSDITFHALLFPVPNKAKIVDMFISNVKHYKKQQQ